MPVYGGVAVRALLLLTLTMGCAATAAAQSSLAEQALEHLERPASQEAPRATPIPASPEADPLRGSALEALAAQSASRAPEEVQIQTAGTQVPAVGLKGLLVVVPLGVVLILGLILTSRQTLNYGLRYSRALAGGVALAALWTLLAAQFASGGGVYQTIVHFLVIPTLFLWGGPLLVSLKEMLVEHEVFRRWFLFERGGSARWAGPRQYRAFSSRTFWRRPDPKEGYTNG